MNTDKRAADVLRWIAWTAIAIGGLLMAFTASDFRAENFPLMVSIGFLIAGINIFIMSTVFRLLNLRKQEV